jgi:hypothetical protein
VARPSPSLSSWLQLSPQCRRKAPLSRKRTGLLLRRLLRMVRRNPLLCLRRQFRRRRQRLMPTRQCRAKRRTTRMELGTETRRRATIVVTRLSRRYLPLSLRPCSRRRLYHSVSPPTHARRWIGYSGPGYLRRALFCFRLPSSLGPTVYHQYSTSLPYPAQQGVHWWSARVHSSRRSTELLR